MFDENRNENNLNQNEETLHENSNIENASNEPSVNRDVNTVNNEPKSEGYYSYTPNSNYSGQYNEQRPPYYQQSPYYQGYSKNTEKNKSGLKIAFSIIGVIAIIIASAAFGYFVVNKIGNHIESNKNDDYSSSVSQSQIENAGKEEKLPIHTNSKPSGANEYITNSDGTLSAAAVIAKVRPAIVGIVQYKNSNGNVPVASGQGSGIIISENGYIVTNAHVVQNSTMLTVVLDNGEEYRAVIKGIDTQTDLAVIKIEETGLACAELGNSEESVVGESVIAIGNPGGLELAGSCTGGMISGLKRTIGGDDATGYATTYIQTDAAINPGNSGGALVNMYGQVIGINTSKIAREGYEGLGFAIPINEAIPIVEDLQQYGYVRDRARIGISYQFISEAVAQYYNNSIPVGILVDDIDETCDVYKKGVAINDIITHIDGKAITSTNVLFNVLNEKKPGETVELTVFRIGAKLSSSKTFSVNVVLTESKN